MPARIHVPVVGHHDDRPVLRGRPRPRRRDQPRDPLVGGPHRRVIHSVHAAHVPVDVHRAEVNKRHPRPLSGQHRTSQCTDSLVGRVPFGNVVLHGNPDKLPPGHLREHRPAVLRDRQRRPPAHRQQRGQARSGRDGQEVRIHIQPVTGEVIAHHVMQCHRNPGGDRPPAWPGPAVRRRVDHDRRERAQRPDGRGSFRAECVIPRSVDPDDKHVIGHGEPL